MAMLKFLRPDFRRGLNYTVSLGDKWGKTLQPGDLVFLGNVEGAFVAEAVITSVDFLAMVNIPDYVFRFEHDPSCCSIKALMAEMVVAYPGLKDKGYLGYELVTVIGFVPLGD